MNISMRQLKAFLLIAQLKNFTRAAERLHITQAGLSVMMRELEVQLASRLFDRTTRSVTLTPAGEKLLPIAQAAVEGLEQVAAQLDDMSDKARYLLRVAATPLVSSTLMPLVISRFRQQYPDVTIRVVDTDLKQVQALVESGAADFGLGFFFEGSKSIERRLLYDFPLVLAGPLQAQADDAGMPAPGMPVPWDSLREQTLIGLPPDNPIQQLVDRQLARTGQADQERASFNHFDTLIAMVAIGLGSAVIPSFAMPACRRHRVSAAPLVQPQVTAGFHQISRKGRGKPFYMAEFTDMLIAMLPQMAAGETQPA
jgi:DNA-binding transcriptional LysR family regulator